jgi:hypothetical protein
MPAPHLPKKSKLKDESSFLQDFPGILQKRIISLKSEQVQVKILTGS